jgi:regulator of nucleoside diphosphate kinase
MSSLNDSMFARPPVFATPEGLGMLRQIASQARGSHEPWLLDEELERITLVGGEEGGAHVAIGSHVTYKDLRTKGLRRVQVTAGPDQVGDTAQVSVLTPVGAALIGLTAGAIFRWREPDGQLRAVKVLTIEA